MILNQILNWKKNKKNQMRIQIPNLMKKRLMNLNLTMSRLNKSENEPRPAAEPLL